MDTRHNQLVLISKKVETANDKINDIISRLGWTRSELTQWQEKQDLANPKRSISAKIPPNVNIVMPKETNDWIHSYNLIIIDIFIVLLSKFFFCNFFYRTNRNQ